MELGTDAHRAIHLLQKSYQSKIDAGSSEWTLQCVALEACISPATTAAVRAVLQLWSHSSAVAALAPQRAGMTEERSRRVVSGITLTFAISLAG